MIILSRTINSLIMYYDIERIYLLKSKPCHEYTFNKLHLKAYGEM